MSEQVAELSVCERNRLASEAGLPSIDIACYCEKCEAKKADERMAAVERQIREAKTHKSSNPKILCPYCGHWNFARKRTFCCELLRFAVVTVLVADRALKQAAAAERAANN